MSRILLAECKQEVSSFNPLPSRYADFMVAFGADMPAAHRGARMEVGGALSVLEQAAEVTLVPTYSARAITSGGALAREDYQQIRAEFLEAIRQAGPVDAAYFALHGAMLAEGEDDPEGDLLAAARQILGEAIPFVVSLDLHGILSERMLRHSDAILAYHTYPHIDFYETGERAARLLLEILAGRARPVTARVAIPALVRGDELITATGLFGRCIRMAQDFENNGGLSAGMFIGNPFTDAPALQSYSFAVADDDAGAAQEAALRMARAFWEMRERLQAELISIEEATRIAAETRGAVILKDAADATSSGASGDSNVLIRALLRSGYRGRILAPLVDPPAVARAFAAGVGAQPALKVGGAIDPRFAPLAITARVRMLGDGQFISESHGTMWDAGRTAVVEAGNLTLVLTSRAVSLYDRSLFLAHGLDPRRFDAVVVKSPHCRPEFYDEWAARTLNVDAPGATSANLPTLGHTKCPRPIFPLDPATPFAPQARVFRRGAAR